MLMISQLITKKRLYQTEPKMDRTVSHRRRESISDHPIHKIFKDVPARSEGLVKLSVHRAGACGARSDQSYMRHYDGLGPGERRDPQRSNPF